MAFTEYGSVFFSLETLKEQLNSAPQVKVEQ